MRTLRPFNTSKKPKIPYPFLMPVEWIGTLAYLIGARGGRITRHGCDGLKTPYLLLSNHASMIDFPMAVKATFPRRCNWVISIEEFVGREWLFRGIGGIYKRKFTSDVTVIRHLITVLKRRRMNCVMYPEARYSLAGVQERMSGALGQLVKTMGCGVAVLIEHGNFIRNPQWNQRITYHTPVTADMYQIVSAEEAASLSAEQIQRRIEEKFVYDDYAWQEEHGVEIRSPHRANNLHQILYQCPVCEEEFCMVGEGTHLRCEHCGASWEMTTLGRLHREGGEDIFTHIPDWYRWERENVRREVRAGTYSFTDTVRLEHLVNCKRGFSLLGRVNLTHDRDGFTLRGRLDNGEDFYLSREPITMESCHIEFDFHKRGVSKRGPAIDLCTLNDTYFVFPENNTRALTKIHFATEALYDLAEEQKHAPAAD